MKPKNNFAINIRKAKLGDLEAIYKIGLLEEGFAVSKETRFYGKDYLRQMIQESEESIILVAEIKEEIAGFVICSLCGNTWAMWDNLAVAEKWQKRGVATKLTKKLLNELQKRGIDYVGGIVRVENKPVIKFLKKFGFEKGYKFWWMERKTRPLWLEHKKDIKRFKKENPSIPGTD